MPVTSGLSTGAMASAMFGTPGADAAIEKAFPTEGPPMVETISNIDKPNLRFEISHHPSLGNSPVFPLALRAYADLMDAGHGGQGIPWGNDTNVVWATVRDIGHVAGFISYNVNKGAKQMWMVFLYTVPEYRNQGVYKLLHQRLERQADRQGITTIAANVHTTNRKSLEVAERLGYKIDFNRIIKSI